MKLTVEQPINGYIEHVVIGNIYDPTKSIG
jgi:hypothetical protein